MGVPVLILGESGQGKSTSLRNLGPEDVGVFNVAAKPLPFRQQMKTVNRPSYETINAGLISNNLRAYVIDDANYLLSFDNFKRAKDTGYGKFVDMAVSFEKMLERIISTNEDTVVYVMMHPEYDINGRMKPKLIGKMLDEKLCVEGLFPIVLIAKRDDEGYHFVTQSDGMTCAKTPIGLFESLEIPNDLKIVDDAIREYWGMRPMHIEKEEEAKETPSE